MQRKSAPGCSRDPPAEKIDEERSAHEGGHGANGKLGRGYNGARERVCNYHCDGASKCGGGKQNAMVGTEKQAHHVRNEQADVANSAADRNRESGQNGGGQRNEGRGEPDWRREVRLRDESEDGSEGGTHGNAENVGVGEWVAKQGLVAGSGHGESRPDDNGEENARQANLNDDHAVITGESLGLVKQDANQISAGAVKGHGNGTELERDHHDNKKEDGEEAALQEKTLQCQRAHACSSERASLPVGAKDEECGDVLVAGALSLWFCISVKASGCSCRARSSTADMMRGAGRLMESLIVT